VSNRYVISPVQIIIDENLVVAAKVVLSATDGHEVRIACALQQREELGHVRMVPQEASRGPLRAQPEEHPGADAVHQDRTKRVVTEL
jgi:hypothetical protein